MKIFTSKKQQANKLNMFQKSKDYLMSTIGFWVVLLIWILVVDNYNPLILPSPEQVLNAIKELLLSGELYTNLLITLRRTIIGYSSAVLSGLVLALLLSQSMILNKILRPIITVIQATPPIIWLSMAIIWFGIAEDLTPIFLIFVVTLPVIFINFLEGIKDIDQDLIEMARVYSCKRKKILLHIYLPALVPHMVSALSIGFAFAWKSTVFAEYLGSSSGIGFALSMANANLETDKLFAWAIILILLMLIVEYFFLRPFQNKVTRWKNNE
jgi:NitT/TauT family transport system permease protein